MGRLIDADALIDDIKNNLWDWETVDGITATTVLKQTISDIGNQPVIEERKTGTWCVTPDGHLVCSNCYNNPTNRIIVDGSLIYDMTPFKKRMRYCPNCGAKMEGEEHDKG